MTGKRDDKGRRSGKDRRNGGSNPYNGPERRSNKFRRSGVDRRKKGKVNGIQKEFLETKTFQANRTERTEHVFEEDKVIGRPVKIMRTGKKDPEEGWQIVGVYFESNLDKLKVSFIKVRRPDEENPRKGLEKTVQLESLIKLNPEIKSLFYDS